MIITEYNNDISLALNNNNNAIKITLYYLYNRKKTYVQLAFIIHQLLIQLAEPYTKTNSMECAIYNIVFQSIYLINFVDSNN